MQDVVQRNRERSLISKQLFDIWETRNGSRARELNMPASIYVDTPGGISVGGSDDHVGTAGVQRCDSSPVGWTDGARG